MKLKDNPIFQSKGYVFRTSLSLVQCVQILSDYSKGVLTDETEGFPVTVSFENWANNGGTDGNGFTLSVVVESFKRNHMTEEFRGRLKLENNGTLIIGHFSPSSGTFASILLVYVIVIPMTLCLLTILLIQGENGLNTSYLLMAGAGVGVLWLAFVQLMRIGAHRAMIDFIKNELSVTPSFKGRK
jgi:hypothetical protein